MPLTQVVEMVKTVILRVTVLVSIALNLNVLAQETFGIQIDQKQWGQGLKTVRDLIASKRSGNQNPVFNDLYSLDWLDYLYPELIEFQIYAVWLDLTIGAPFKDPARRLPAVIERLQASTSIERANAFLEEHCFVLGESYFSCGVEPEYIAGIISIETFFGTYKNVFKFPTLATLASWVALNNPTFRSYIIGTYKHAIDAKQHFVNNRTDKNFSTAKYDFSQNSIWENRALSRSKRSISQLRDLLNLAESMNLNYDSIIKLEGSWVGAITDGQFMPTTLRDILKAGEIIDPHDLGDVIPLMARYLMPYWGESPEQINKAIGRYNSPKWYRTHVTTVAKLVEARWKELESEFNSDE